MSTRRAFFSLPNKKSSDRVSTRTNPFDSDTDSGTAKNPARASSAPPVSNASSKNSVSTETENRDTSRSLYSGFSTARNGYKNEFRDSGGLENQSVQELENYAVYRAEENTRKVHECVKIGEEIRETGSRNLVAIYQQGQQINRTHEMALDIDQHLSRSEKLLGDLGGIFSRKWKPKKNHAIKGPMLTRDDSFIRKGSHMEQRQKFGLSDDRAPRSNIRRSPNEPTSALEKVEAEKAKQDDALSDLSNILAELKGMATDMGAEIDRQTVALGHVEPDIDELNYRVKGANTQARRLLGK